ncbi:MAG: nucleotidyltransferase domain-containing protein [bacterium]
MNVAINGKRPEIVDLCRQFHVRRLELFGSAAGEEFDPLTSDLDFLVLFESCAPGEHYERYFGFVEALESLFGRSVDLVEADALHNPYFIRGVNESKTLVYAA